MEAILTTNETQTKKRLALIELVLLLIGFVILLFGYITILYNQHHYITTAKIILPVLYAVIILFIHKIIRIRIPYTDPLLLPIVNVINGIGLLIIFRLDYQQIGINNTAEANSVNSFSFTTHQLYWLLISGVVFTAIVFILSDYKKLANYQYILGFLGIIFLTIPIMLPNKYSEVNGSKIWIITPFFSIQPGEIAKIFIICFTAAYLINHRELILAKNKKYLKIINLPRPKDLIPILAIIFGAIFILVIERDLGSSLLIFCTMLIMLYIATEKWSWILVSFIIFTIFCLIAYQIFPHLHTRLIAWQDPFKDFSGSGWQLSQSLFSFGAGGLAGTGLGKGRPDLIPANNTDFIIAAVAEEGGLITIFGLLILFLILISRGFKTAILIRDNFGKLFTSGLTTVISIQLLIITAGITKLIPLTGLTTPFMSYGGSSLLANFILLALLSLVSNSARKPDAAKAKLLNISDAVTEMVKIQ